MLPRYFSLRALALTTILVVGGLSVVAPVDAHAPTPALSGRSAGAVAGELAGTPAAKKAKDPRKRLGLFVDSKMPAYQQGGAYRRKIGTVSQAFWVIPEAYGTDSVRSKVNEYTGDARAARKTPVLTIYGIPGRDCGWYSSGNPLTTAAEYRAWIKQVARGLKSTKALVVLEPDALPLFSSSVQSCPTKPDGWKGMLRFASKRLSASGAWVYLDAGHSNWTPYETRPLVLKQAGVQYARGISTNVSNFRTTGSEKVYATKMLRGLRKLGVKGKHYVVDTSRNGRQGGPKDGVVINPPWARVGARPKLVFKGAFDGTLWVKHPGESDGTECGGPSSGQWSDLLADRLIGRDRSDSC